MSAEPASPLDQVEWPITTARLALRRATPDDAEAVISYRGQLAVGLWLSSLRTDLPAWTSEWERRCRNSIIVELEHRVIGDLRIAIRDPEAQAEVAEQAAGTEAELMWAFHPESQGHGYATEAVRELIEIGFTKLGLRRLTAGCFADNGPSWRLMERLGMWREGHGVRSALHRDGTWQDFLTYGILAPGE
jgi:RimJ/RimL family protein N-acetyltransferase